MKLYDVCIIGSGAAGAFLLQELKSSTLSVAVLESGTNKPDFDTSHFIDRVHVPWENSLVYSCSKQIGGTTNIWGGKISPFQKFDFERKISAGGWPLTLSELKPYYNKASDVLGVPYLGAFDQSTPLADYGSANEVFSQIKQSMLEVKTLSWSKPPFSAKQLILQYSKENCHLNIDLYSNCHVTQLIEHPDKHVISCIEFIDENKTKQYLKAQYVVVAAGGLENARLLLNSRQKSSQGIANEYDVVGRYLSTHPKVRLGTLNLSDSMPLNNPLFSNVEQEGYYFRQGVGLCHDIMIEKGLLNHYIELSPLMDNLLSSAYQKVKHSQFIGSVSMDIIRRLKKSSKRKQYQFLEISRGKKYAKKFNIQLFLDQYPNPNNRVKMGYSNDIYGFPKLDIDWDLSDKDKSSIHELLDVIDVTFRQSNLGYLENSRYQNIDDWSLTALHSHFMGTTRMGKDPKMSVVDKNSKAHAYQNLFIAGPSVFSTYGYANPMYTIAALSIRLGEHLRDITQS